MKRFFWPLLFLMLPSQMYAATLLKNDFNTASPAVWPSVLASSLPRALVTTVALLPVGTVDVANTAQSSGGLLLTARNIPAAQEKWRTTLVSGLLPIDNAETNLGKLALSFSLSASIANPVIVRGESYNAAKKRTGELPCLIYPAAPDFYQRYALDLSTLKPFGAGKFQPTAPFGRFSFEIGSATGGGGWP